MHEEVPKEKTAVKTVRAQHLAIRCSGQPKKRTQGNGGSRKKLATTCRSSTAQGHSRQEGKGKTVPRTKKGWTFRKRRRAQLECSKGMRDRGAIRLHLRKETTTSNGIKGRSRRQDLHMGSMMTLHEASGQTLGFKFAKQTFGTCIRLSKMTTRTLWSGRPPPKRNKILQTE
jgi:hypothetical protein